MNKWYIIKTKPQREPDVSHLLSKASFEVFFPKIREVFYKTSLAHFKMKPLFPSYLFLNIDFDDAANIHMVKYTRGVSKILCAENRPLSVPSEVITTIRSRTNGRGVLERQCFLKPGDSVRVRRGLLKDLIGVLEKPASDEERVIVLLRLVNYNMRATLHWTEIEKLHAA